MSKIINKFTSELQLIVDSELKDFLSASQNLNPFLTYVRFILTDSMPNGNGLIIPKEEFANLIQTGLFMPLKMAAGEIKEGHEDAVPLGVITHLRVDDDKIRGVAALWNKERPADISFIKEKHAKGEPLDLSWELGFDPEESQYDDDGYLVLRGCVLRATTLVGIPAYMGRTNITDIDSANADSKEEDTVKELEELQLEVETLQAEIKTLKEENEELKEKQVTKEILSELEDLRTYHKTTEAARLKLETLAEIREAFEEAGISKDEEFFNENEENLLALKESEMLDFFISNLVSEEGEDDSDSKDDIEDEDLDEEEASKNLPKIRGIQPDKPEYTMPDLAKALRENRNKQSK